MTSPERKREQQQEPPHDRVKGWCPGTLRPMATGDGLLMRVKPPAGRLTPEMLRAIAALGRRYGSGAFDLSQRGQLQMRGLTSETYPYAAQGLADLGLLPKDADDERGLSILASPFMARRDGAPAWEIYRALRRILTEDAELRALPPKFGFAIDDGGLLSLTDGGADILLLVARDGVFLCASGDDALAARTDVAQAADDAAALARLFLARARENGGRRMKTLIAAQGSPKGPSQGAASLFKTLSLNAAPHPLRPPTPLAAFLGAHEAESGAFVGVGAPFGRWRAQDLETLAQTGAADIRLSHRRAFILHHPTNAQALADDLARAGLIAQADDPRLAIAPCPGAPECSSALMETRAQAERYAQMIGRARPAAAQEKTLLHISGCPKGCAHPGSAPLVLRGTPEGCDLVENGAAADPAALSGLTPDQAYCEIARRMSGLPPQ